MKFIPSFESLSYPPISLFKMQLLTIKPLFGILVVFIGCTPANTESNLEKTISQLTDKFPQLPKGKGNQSDYYRLIRSVRHGENRSIRYGEKGFEIQLRATPDSIPVKEQIIVLINSQGQQYAIPFLSNGHLDYWNFPFDYRKQTTKPTNTTFEKELTTALNTLQLNDTVGTAGTVIGELLASLLHCRRVTERDSAHLNIIMMSEDTGITDEDDDSCSQRIKKNYRKIASTFHPISNYATFFDQKNGRIYQVQYNLVKRYEKLNFSLTVYRQDCAWTLKSL